MKFHALDMRGTTYYHAKRVLHALKVALPPLQTFHVGIVSGNRKLKLYIGGVDGWTDRWTDGQTYR
jgi:hypothetical protein